MQIKKFRNLALVISLAGLSANLYASNGIHTDETLKNHTSAPHQYPRAANGSDDQIVPTQPGGNASGVPNNQGTATTQQSVSVDSYFSYLFNWFGSSKNEEKIAVESNSTAGAATSVTPSGENNATPSITEEKLRDYAKKHGRNFDELCNSILIPTPKLATASDTPAVETISLKVPEGMALLGKLYDHDKKTFMPVYEEFLYNVRGANKKLKKTLNGLELWKMYRDAPHNYIKFTQVKYGDNVLYSVSS